MNSGTPQNHDSPRPSPARARAQQRQLKNAAAANATRPAPALKADDLARAMDKMRFAEMTHAPYLPDVLILTAAAYGKVYMSEDTEIVAQTSETTLCGIPFEVFKTVDECTLRALQLREQGKKVAVIFDDPK